MTYHANPNESKAGVVILIPDILMVTIIAGNVDASFSVINSRSRE